MNRYSEELAADEQAFLTITVSEAVTVLVREVRIDAEILSSHFAAGRESNLEPKIYSRHDPDVRDHMREDRGL